MSIPADQIESPAKALVGSDNKSHIVSAFGEAWCDDIGELEMFDEAADVDCKRCIWSFEHPDADEIPEIAR